METRREVIKRSEMESIQNNKTSMSWISSEMMRDRGAGPFDNYGEMLYAESLESLARKRDKVSEWWGLFACTESVPTFRAPRNDLRHQVGVMSHELSPSMRAVLLDAISMCVCALCLVCAHPQAQRVKAQRDIEEVQGVTFHPEISRHAQTIWGPHEVGSVPVWQRLSKGE